MRSSVEGELPAASATRGITCPESAKAHHRVMRRSYAIRTRALLRRDVRAHLAARAYGARGRVVTALMRFRILRFCISPRQSCPADAEFACNLLGFALRLRFTDRGIALLPLGLTRRLDQRLRPAMRVLEVRSAVARPRA